MSNRNKPLQNPKELIQQIETLQSRISMLNAAILRISKSLDVGTVLREVVESARELTGARYGLIVTIDDSGQVQEFVSSGFTPEEHRQMADWPDGPRLFEHFRDLPGVLRGRDLYAYAHSLGYSHDLLRLKTFQGTPMRHQGTHLGNFFLGEKECGREFTSDDEEVLVLFASQAATAIANARTYRNVYRARADLEALIDISPVGVAVFDARTGRPTMLNREAKRMKESLTPGRMPEQVLEVLKVRRADGRELCLEELPLAQALSSGETVRVEEIVLEVPGGRTITMLVNATSIRSEQGAVESVVVTLQDLAPLEDLERSRAEFLGMVSHELRAPLASIKGSAATVLDAAPSPNRTEMLQFFRIINEQANHMHSLISDLLDAEQIETGSLSVSPAPEGVGSLVDQAKKTFLSSGGRHIVQIDLPADLPQVMADRQRIVQVLNNLFSNASRYAPESSPIRVDAVQDDVYVAISVSDEGRGVQPDLLPHLFRKHVNIGGEERGVRGSGLGLAICKGLVEAHGGRIRAESDGKGLGTRVTFTIPVCEEVGAGAAPGLDRSASVRSRAGRGRDRILVVDDDPETLRYVRNALAAAGFSPLVTGDPQAVPHLVRTKKPQLVLMDLILPGTDGIELMQRVPELSDLPVIFISAYGRDETIVRALETGATDYVVKPFSTAELVARVQAALRRHQAVPEAFHLGHLTIHYDQHQVTLAGRPVPLTATEYELLRVLSVNAGWVMTYDVLLRQVWGRTESGDSQPVRTYVKKLRRKLGDSATNSTYIFTVRGVGYRMAKPSDD